MCDFSGYDPISNDWEEWDVDPYIDHLELAAKVQARVKAGWESYRITDNRTTQNDTVTIIWRRKSNA